MTKKKKKKKGPPWDLREMAGTAKLYAKFHKIF